MSEAQQEVQSYSSLCRRNSGVRSIAPSRYRIHLLGHIRKSCRPGFLSHSPAAPRFRKNSPTCFEGPFGEVLRKTGDLANANPFRFSTKYQDDETGLLYYGHRYYDAITGRWLSRDPKCEKGGQHLYAFVKNAPTLKVDRLGLDAALINAGGATGHTMFLVGNASDGMIIYHFYALGHKDSNNSCCKSLLGICCDKAWIWTEGAADWDLVIRRAKGHGWPVEVWDYAFGTPIEDKIARENIENYIKDPGYYSLLFGRNCHTESYDWFKDYVAGGGQVDVKRPTNAASWWPQHFWVTAGRADDLTPQWPLDE